MGKVPENLLQHFREYLTRLEVLADTDGSYKMEAYSFVMSALHHTLKELKESRHVSGAELLQGIRSYARDQYGPMTHTVLDHWGIHETIDFGRIVFKLVDAGFMTKTDEDSLEDFKNVYNFNEAFDQPFEWTVEDE